MPSVVVMLAPDREHCVQSVAKKTYRSCLRQCLASEPPSPNVAEQLEVMRRFLGSADFPRLRAECAPRLAAGETLCYRVWLEGDGVAWSMETAPGRDSLEK